MHESDTPETDGELTNQIGFPSFRGSFKLTSLKAVCCGFINAPVHSPPPPPHTFQSDSILFHLYQRVIFFWGHAPWSLEGSSWMQRLRSWSLASNFRPTHYWVMGSSPHVGTSRNCIWVMDPLIYPKPSSAVFLSRVKIAAWEAPGEALIRLWRRQQTGGILAVVFSVPLPTGGARPHTAFSRSWSVIRGMSGSSNCKPLAAWPGLKTHANSQGNILIFLPLYAIPSTQSQAPTQPSTNGQKNFFLR